MIKTLQPHPLQGPQNAEFRLEHPDAPALASTEDHHQADTGDLLVVSPYTSESHLLHLRHLDLSQQLLAKSLTVLENTRSDYATASYAESFNWDAVIAKLKTISQEQSFIFPHQYFYIVVFRSRIPPTTDRLELGALDEKSHAEATKSGGLLKYWFGTPDENGRNLATCVWRQQSDARPASTGPGHKAAIRATVSMYTEWKIEKLKFDIDDGANAWSITDWEG